MSKPKQNFVKKIKRKKNQEWQTDFHLSISSKAMFELSDTALKLYMILLMHGKGKYISTKTLAYRLKKSERSIQRYRDELKEKGFLKVVMIEPKKFQYIFDYKGMLNEVTKHKEETKEIEYFEEEKEEIIIEEEIVEIEEEASETDFILTKARTIIDYTDFAILENKFWTFEEETKNKIIEILKIRLEKEPNNKEVIEWFLDKTII